MAWSAPAQGRAKGACWAQVWRKAFDQITFGVLAFQIIMLGLMIIKGTFWLVRSSLHLAKPILAEQMFCFKASSPCIAAPSSLWCPLHMRLLDC